MSTNGLKQPSISSPSPFRKSTRKEEERHAFWRSLLLKCPVFVPVPNSTHRLQRITVNSIAQHVDRARSSNHVVSVKTMKLGGSGSVAGTAPGGSRSLRDSKSNSLSRSAGFAPQKSQSRLYRSTSKNASTQSLRSSKGCSQRPAATSPNHDSSLLAPDPPSPTYQGTTVFQHLPQESYIKPMGSKGRMRELTADDWKYLEKLQTELGLCNAEITYAKLTIRNNPELGLPYLQRTKSIADYNHAFTLAYKERSVILARAQKIIKELWGSRLLLLRSIERIRALTIYMCSLLNAARLLCGKPVILPGLNLYSTENWLYDLRHEAFMSRKTTAILFTIYKFFGHKKYEDLRSIVNVYFTSCITDLPPVLSSTGQQINKTFGQPLNEGGLHQMSKLGESILAPLTNSAAKSPGKQGDSTSTHFAFSSSSQCARPALEASYVPGDSFNNVGYFSRMDGLSLNDTIYDDDADVDRITAGDVALYLLLGVNAEEVFDGDDMGTLWNEHIDRILNMQHLLSNVATDELPVLQELPVLDIPLLKGMQIVEMARTETFIVSDYMTLLKDFADVGLNVVCIPVDPSDSFEMYRTNFDLSSMVPSASVPSDLRESELATQAASGTSEAEFQTPVTESGHRPDSMCRSSIFSMSKSICIEED